MNNKEYQIAAKRTMNNSLELKERLTMLSMGLAGESGELIDHIKKYAFHGHSVDCNYVAKEIGDVMWYVANLANEFNMDLDQILEINVDKLKKRYPDGFSEKASRERAE